MVIVIEHVMLFALRFPVHGRKVSLASQPPRMDNAERIDVRVDQVRLQR